MDRTYITLNENWKFHYGEVPEGGTRAMTTVRGLALRCRMTGQYTCRLSRLIPAELDI